ncbi:glucose-6-phosphatase 2-like [Scleropages formosus]|uniref:Glucose-6-phosphatase 2-like n=1 Tax=Scleropages formosus TaxID=113540 RepID=A0A0P7YZE9_SCLFO|nr:glucose-6-phosphatase 2-like [Scleropages formosus]
MPFLSVVELAVAENMKVISMDFIHSSEVLVIQYLQSTCRDYQAFFSFMSSVGDPRNILSFYFPLCFQVSHVVGIKMLWVAVIGDWFNLIFKWVFVATHFPHQVILGVLAGVLVAEAFEHLPSIHTANLNVYIQTNLFLLSFASGFYLLHRMANIDLMWSVPKAKKWCVDPAWIHLDSSPFAGLVRNSGALLGLGLALHSQMFLQSCRGRNGQRASFRLVCTGASLGALRLCELMEVSMKTEFLFHAFSFCKSAVGPLSVVALVPYCLHVLTGVRENKLH